MSIEIIFNKYDKCNNIFCTETNEKICEKEIMLYILSFNQNYIITKKKNLYVYGLNESGQLGVNKQAVFIDKLNKNNFFNNKIVFVANGVRHSIFLTNEAINNIYASGNNMYGQLGLNTEYNTCIPKQIFLNKKIIKVACGIEHTLLLTDEYIDNLYGFGNNFSHQLGNDTHIKFNTPINIKTNSKISNIDCSQHTSICLDNNGNLLLFGIYKKKVFNKPKLININKKIISCNINYLSIYFLTSDIINNLYMWDTCKLTKNILPDKNIVGMIKQNETIICTDSDNNYYYYGKKPSCVNNNIFNTVFECPLVNKSDHHNIVKNVNFGSSYTIYNSAYNSFNNSVYITVNNNVMDNNFIDIIKNKDDFDYKIINLSPSGTIFSDHIDFTIYPTLESNHYDVYYYSKTDTVPYKLDNVDNDYGAYYILDDHNTYKIYTTHFSKICLLLRPEIDIKEIKKKYFFTGTNNKIEFIMECNYVEDFIIDFISITDNFTNKRLSNKIINKLKINIIGKILIINSPYEIDGRIYFKITSINRPNTFNFNFNIKFINNVKLKKKYIMSISDILKINLQSLFCNFDYNKHKIKIKYKNGILIIYPLKKCITHINILSELYNFKIKIIIN